MHQVIVLTDSGIAGFGQVSDETAKAIGILLGDHPERVNIAACLLANEDAALNGKPAPYESVTGL